MSTDSYIHLHRPGAPGGPLIFAFHGTGADENQLAGLAAELVPGATGVSPRGDVSEQGAARFFKRTGEGVYDMADLARATAKMTAFVRAHRDAAKPSAVLGLGYSNGANILASVMFGEPALFDGAVLMHPLIPFEPRFEGTPTGKVLITAGRRDPICPPQMTQRLADALAAAGASTDIQWHDGGHEVRPTEIDTARGFLSTWAAKGKVSA